MLSEKPWKTDAILRLCVSVLLCFFIGQLATMLLEHLRQPGMERHEMFFIAVGSAFVLYSTGIYLLSQPWRPETLLLRFILLLVSVYGGFFFTWWAAHFEGDMRTLVNSTWQTVIAVLSFQGAALVLVHRFLREHQIGWSSAFGFTLERHRALLLGATVAIVFFPIGVGFQRACFAILERFQMHPHEQEAVQVLRATETWPNRAVIGIAAILIAPIAEEILFRGILYPAIKRAGFPRLALWGTSLLFGAIHFNLVSFLPLTLLALILVWLYEKTDNLLSSIVAHSLFNGINFAMLYLGESLPHLHT